MKMQNSLRSCFAVLAFVLLVSVAASAQQPNEYRRTQEPRYSPDGKLIIFSATVSTGATDISKGISVMDADGTNMRMVTPNVPGILDESPSISSDGSKIVFIRETEMKQAANQKDVYIVNLDGTGLKQLTNTVEAESNPEFTGDNKGVIFVRLFRTTQSIMNHYDSGALISLNLSDGKEQIVLDKKYQVIHAFSAPRGFYIVLLGKLDANLNPLPIDENGTTITLVAPDGELNRKGELPLPAKAKQTSKISVAFGSGVTILAMGDAGFADYFRFIISPKGTEEVKGLTGIDYQLSPDGLKLISWGLGDSVSVRNINIDEVSVVGNEK